MRRKGWTFRSRVAPAAAPWSSWRGAGSIDIGGPVGYATIIHAAAKGLPVITPWVQTTQNIFAIVVPESSRFMSVKDLKGQKIGVYSPGSDGVPMAKAMAQEAGLDPNKDISLVPIGLGGQAVNAITSGQVVGGSYWDTGIALMEVLGVKFRYLTTPGVQKDAKMSSGYVINTKWMKNNRAVAVRYFRAITKASIFVQHNPTAAIQVHWKLFPISKKLGKKADQAQQLRDMTHVLKARLRSVIPYKGPSTKFGRMERSDWAATMGFYVKTGAIEAKVDLDKVFTNELVEEANKVDHARIIKMAKSYK